MKVVHVDRLKPYEGEPRQSWLENARERSEAHTREHSHRSLQNIETEEEADPPDKEALDPLASPMIAPLKAPVSAPRRNFPRATHPPDRYTR